MFKKFIPGWLKRTVRDKTKKYYSFKDYEELHEQFKFNVLQERQLQEITIPKYDLKKEHILNAMLLLDRMELLSRMKKNAVCAEIGVNKGDFSSQIIQITKPKKLHLIDAWGDEKRYHDGLKKLVIKKI